MKLDNETICEFGKAVFYASLLPELKRISYECGWAIGLHGSLNSDMDIMAMPWTDKAIHHQKFIKKISDGCFKESPFAHNHTIPYKDKPNNRIVYTLSIWKDYYLDINIIGG